MNGHFRKHTYLSTLVQGRRSRLDGDGLMLVAPNKPFS